MLHKEVLSWFKIEFPMLIGKIETYWPNGKNSIRVRLLDKQEFVFTYNGVKDWKLQTIDNAIRDMKAGL